MRRACVVEMAVTFGTNVGFILHLAKEYRETLHASI